jgi:hypothetical protein
MNYILFLLAVILFLGCDSNNNDNIYLVTEQGLSKDFGLDAGLYRYNRDNLCIDLNSPSLKIDVPTRNIISNTLVGISLDEILIYRNIVSNNYILVAKYVFFDSAGHSLLSSEWELDLETRDEMIDYYLSLAPEERFYPGDIYGTNYHWFPKYCGWEPNTSKEIE